MKKIIAIVILIIFVLPSHGQSYEITFSASGTASSLDSVNVVNQTQGTQLTLLGYDTLLLTNNTGLSNPTTPENELVVYPNPSNGIAYADLQIHQHQKVIIDILDISGRKIVSKTMTCMPGEYAISMAGLGKGMFVCNIQTKQWEKSAHFILSTTTGTSPSVSVSSTSSASAGKMPLMSLIQMRLISMIQMGFWQGDMLQFTGYSGTYFKTVTLSPTQSQTIDFYFPVPPLADFSATPTSGAAPLSVSFTDLSSNSPTSWAWDFGDGQTSTQQNPSHTYVSNGVYTVSLIATNSYGSDTETKTDYIVLALTGDPPLAEFTADTLTINVNDTVSFTDQSINSPTSWKWYFGDGDSSSIQNPNHAYDSAGVYTVNLTATSSFGSDTEIKNNYITVSITGNPPVADFIADTLTINVNDTVSFTDQSINSPTSWKWYFGDGDSSSIQNPNHAYDSAGVYTVSLTATSSFGSDTEIKNNYITVASTPCSGITPPAGYDIVVSSGKCWLDRNLGATQVATSSADTNAYGDLYQWGRAADGHESRASSTTSILATSDTPGHGDFIVSNSNPYDWRNPQNNNLWQGVNGINNPCPSGYRLPTEAEWDTERLSWSSNDAAGAFASPLKLPVAGRRTHSSGSLDLVGSFGYYWSSTVVGSFAYALYFYSSDAYMNSLTRAGGRSVRCLKD